MTSRSGLPPSLHKADAPRSGDPWASGTLLVAAQRVGAAARVLWLTLVAWTLFAVAGLQLLAARTASSQDRYGDALGLDDRAETIAAFGLVALLATGAAVGALLALWCSSTADAARSAGRRHAVDLSSLAWWGLLVPVGALVLPVLAYVQTARYASTRTGGTEREHVALLIAWWVLFDLAALALAGAVVLGGERGAGGAGLLLCGVLGAASTACGGVALRRVAAEAHLLAEQSTTAETAARSAA